MSKIRQSSQAVKITVGFFLLILSAVIIIFWLLVVGDLSYQNKIYPGVSVAGLRVGGLDQAAVRSLVKERARILDKGEEFSYQDKKIVISPSSVSFDGDLVYQLFAVDVDQSAAAAYKIGRGGRWFDNWRQKLACRFWSCAVSLAIDYNQPKILDLLKQEFGSYETPARSAELVWRPDGSFEISQEKFGHRFDYQAAFGLFLNNLQQARTEPIRLILEEESPQIFKRQVGDIGPQIDKWLKAAPLVLILDKQSWTAGLADIRGWLDLKTTYQNSRQSVDVDLSEEKMGVYFAKAQFMVLHQAAEEARFEVLGGRVSLFQAARDGRELDLATTMVNVRQAVADNLRQASLAMKVTGAETAQSDVNDFGITEIIGTGTSTFAGSPPNRRHNIKVGADALNGVLIKPNEEFSLLKALGKIDASTGYLPELVIKQNKTVPEYGGGLCQIGTTSFRAALSSGLPITMRRNHSYRVSYYEPAGTDATIYDPWPDFKFINDTGNYILIQTRISGDTLIFDFWGKRDGRTIEQTKPVIYNIVKPPVAKTIETLDLPVGQKKCTEKAHNGASAYFDYEVTYPDGQTKSKRFSSYYVPWQEVCLVGVDKLSEPSGVDLPPVNPDAAEAGTPTGTP